MGLVLLLFAMLAGGIVGLVLSLVATHKWSKRNDEASTLKKFLVFLLFLLLFSAIGTAIAFGIGLLFLS